MFTYYFIQGLTFSTQNVCLDIDSETANSLYVGISRVTQLKQIVEIESKELLNMLYTEYKNDKYFYKLYKPSSDLIDHLKYFSGNRFYKFDDSNLKFREVSNFNNKSNTFLKTLKITNSLKRTASLEPIQKKQKTEISELSKVLWTLYKKKN